MFQLQIADTDISSGSVVVSWCLDIEMLKNLVEKGFNDPQVVIITTPVKSTQGYTNNEFRKIVPLKDLMAYVSFKCSGKNKIYAFISNYSANLAYDRYLSKNNGQYITSLINFDGDSLLSFTKHLISLDGEIDMAAEPIEVYVPEESFAKQPSNFEKTWVNHFFRDKVIDQCQFRRRRLFAYLLQPFLMLCNITIRLILFTICFTLGIRTNLLQTILHPLTYSMAASIDMLDGNGSYFIRDINLYDDNYDNKLSIPIYIFKKYCFFPFTPIFIMLYIGAMFNSFARILLTTLLGSLILAAVTCSIINLIINRKTPNSLFAKINAWFDRKDDNISLMNHNNIQLVICDNKKKINSIYDLPAKNRTLYLHYQDLKSRVCRPFSQ